tara:strand:+ start:20587 stop:20826 length:240 start_codon:yes stop_codon:yes gene_type:complete
MNNKSCNIICIQKKKYEKDRKNLENEVIFYEKAFINMNDISQKFKIKNFIQNLYYQISHLDKTHYNIINKELKKYILQQ